MSFLSKLFGKKFETQSDLAEILWNGQKGDEWERAADKLEDQYLMIEVLTRSPLAENVKQNYTTTTGCRPEYERIYNSLAQRITDPVAAKKILLENPYGTDDSIKYFSRIIRNEKDIETILLHWEHRYHYEYFLDKVRDENILLNLARNASLWNIRYSAAVKLGNHDVIDALIEESLEEINDVYKLRNIHNPKVLQRIVQDQKHSDKIRLEAAILLKDDELIKSFAEKMGWSHDYDFRLYEHLKEFSDEQLLWIINSQKLESYTRQKAIEHIKDTSLLDEVAEQCENDELRVRAYMRSPKYSEKMEQNGIKLSDLHSSELSVRQKTADQLITLANSDPEILLPIWDYLKKTIEQPVELHIVSTYDLDEAGWDRYVGIGKQFPDKPAAKNGE